MTIINVKIANFALALESDNEEQLQKLVKEVNRKIDNVKIANPGISDIKALLVTMIFLQEAIHQAENSVSDKADVLANKKYNDLISSFHDILNSAAEKIEVLSNLINK